MIEFAFVPAVGGLVFLALYRMLQMVAIARHWASWVPVACIAGGILALVIAAAVAALVGEIRTMRMRREHAVMQQRFPGCHVLRLSNGNWFLTDRATGREYQPAAGMSQASSPGSLLGQHSAARLDFTADPLTWRYVAAGAPRARHADQQHKQESKCSSPRQSHARHSRFQ
ncbi:hypothetical protein [Paraburkholderia sp. CI3]|uniref:hypothetical protein n=1 Tax=Paraburkholderia sp. CI3 TaxID=2991060 RepID=UPI003D24152B